MCVCACDKRIIKKKQDITSLGIEDWSESEVELLKVAGHDGPYSALPQASSASAQLSDSEGTGSAAPSPFILKYKECF